MTLKHLKSCLAFAIMQLPMSRMTRYHFAKMGGVKIKGNHVLIGANVRFDTVYPQNIVIGNNVHITERCVFLTHYLDTAKDGINWLPGHIEIGDNTFIGCNTIVCKSAKIGKNVIIGAGSVVTKDIPDNEIWAGNPARFIKKR